MGVQFKNNAESTLDTAISASDTGLAVAYGDGSLFPSLDVDEYFYMTIEDTDGNYEIVTVTARSGDSMTITRAQESTTARAFTAGARCELRVTRQGWIDFVSDVDNIDDGAIPLDKLTSTNPSRIIGRTSSQDSFKEITANNVLEMIGSTRGQILYRGASSWSALGVGTAGQVLQTGGAGADPSWATGILITDGDKGSITVSSSGTVWTLDDAAVTLAKMANLNQYELIGRSSSGAGVPQAIATSADVFALLGTASDSAFRTELGLGSIATQAASSVAITGGTASGLTVLQGTVKASTNTTGTLALADGDCMVSMTGDITFNGGVFSARQAFLLYAGSSSRTVTQGTSMTLRLGGTATTGDRTLAAYTIALAVVIDTNTIVVTGAGVT